METWKKLTFDKTHLHVREIADKEYGSFVWPCAVEITEYLSKIAHKLKSNSKILEIGCGTGLPGLFMGKLGHHIVFSDIDDPKLIQNIALQAEKNEIKNFDYIELNWTIPSHKFVEFLRKDLPIDLLIASDVLYDSKLTSSFFSTIALILHYHPHCKIILSYQERVEKTFRSHLLRWKLKCELVHQNEDIYIFELSKSHKDTLDPRESL